MPSTIYTVIRNWNPTKPLPYGIYVELTDGSGNNEIVYPDKWDKQGILNSWIIITKQKSFKIHPMIQGNYGIGTTDLWRLWGSYNIYIDNYPYRQYTTSYDDIYGEEHTELVVSALGDLEPAHDSSLYPCKICKNTSFPDGSVGGYLPAQGDEALFFQYSSVIYSLMKNYSFATNYGYYNSPFSDRIRYGFFNGVHGWFFTSTLMTYTGTNTSYSKYFTTEFSNRWAVEENWSPYDVSTRRYIHYEWQSNISGEYGYPYLTFGTFDNS